MKFRPCIDIHDGAVKQIVGSSLDDKTDSAKENFVATHDAGYYAAMYKEKELNGGHVISLPIMTAFLLPMPAALEAMMI